MVVTSQQSKIAIEAVAAKDAEGHGWNGHLSAPSDQPAVLTAWLKLRSKRCPDNALGGTTPAGSLRRFPVNDKPPLSLGVPMLAVPTANVWEKTQLMLHSLVALNDPFQLLVIDEQSTDGTLAALHNANITVRQSPAANGVTYNWNLAYQAWLSTTLPYLFISNNDVLIPNGVLDALSHAFTPEGGDCDLVAPLTTVLGKGTWGRYEGAEVLFDLNAAARRFVQQPLNYKRVQDALRNGGCIGPTAVKQNRDIHNMPGFSGFFFGVRRSSVARFAFNSTYLFNPAFRNIGQEGDLTDRLNAQGGKICLHTGAWVFHYKGSTIPPAMGEARENFNVTQVALDAAEARAVAKAKTKPA